MLMVITVVLFIVVFLIQREIYIKFWWYKLTYELEFEKTFLMEGDDNVLTETVQNDKLLPLPVLHIKFRAPRSFLFQDNDFSVVTDYYYRSDHFTMKGHRKVVRRMPFTCCKRGCYTIDDFSLVSSDLLVTQLLRKQFYTEQIVYVVPKRMDISSFEGVYHLLAGEVIVKIYTMEDPFEFKAIRDYQPYDSMRSINWNLSARNQKLLVNTYHPTASSEIKILLNIDKNSLSTADHVIEGGIRIAATLAEQFLKDKITVSIDTNGYDCYTKEIIGLGSGCGSRHMMNVDMCLARIDLSLGCGEFLDILKHNFLEKNSNDIIYVIISNNRSQKIIDLLASFNNRIFYKWIVPEQDMSRQEQENHNMVVWEV